MTKVCISCQINSVHRFLSMHCWSCFNKRFTDTEQTAILAGDKQEIEETQPFGEE